VCSAASWGTFYITVVYGVFLDVMSFIEEREKQLQYLVTVKSKDE
jgi:hypothetical protein